MHVQVAAANHLARPKENPKQKKGEEEEKKNLSTHVHIDTSDKCPDFTIALFKTLGILLTCTHLKKK